MKIEEILEESKKLITNFKQKNKNWIVIIWGATATGKTKLSILLSKFFDIEIISSDSRQIFKYMNIWTDKISNNIIQKIPHHQIDIINPDEAYTAWQRKKNTEIQISNIIKKNKIPFIVWWTWLYIDTIYKNYSMPECKPNEQLRSELFKKEEEQPGFLHTELQKIDPKEAKKIHPNSTRYLVRAIEIFHETWIPKSIACKENPVEQPILMLWLVRDKETTNKLIAKRITKMFDDWLIQEVKLLLKKWYKTNLQSMQGIGYKETIKYLEWEYDIETLKTNIQKNTQHLAKKQRTRFRRYINDSNKNPKNNVTYKIFKL